MSGTKAAGNRGEVLTADYLCARGYKIVEWQFRCRYGEIDLIARKGALLCFVEVKLRGSRKFGLPREFVTEAKQKRLRRTAEYYLAMYGEEVCARFDVAEIYDDETPTRIEYIEDAFI